jgi:hypothetical protein
VYRHPTVMHRKRRAITPRQEGKQAWEQAQTNPPGKAEPAQPPPVDWTPMFS